MLYLEKTNIKEIGTLTNINSSRFVLFQSDFYNKALWGMNLLFPHLHFSLSVWAPPREGSVIVLGLSHFPYPG